MTAQVAQNIPFAKFTRAGFGFSPKNRITTEAAQNDDEDWYIPYNGPYEAPRELPTRRKARDSWGDPLEPDDEEDMVLNDRELHIRYGGYNSPNYGGSRLEEERIGRRRDRTLSVTSGQTGSSGVIEPSRPSIGANRPSTASAGTRPNPSSYLSMDTTGGVGESPIPPRRSSQERNRISLAGIFNFNAQPRKRCAPTASTERSISGNFMRKPSLLQRSNVGTGYDNEKLYSKMDAPTRYGSSPEHPNPPAKDKHQQLYRQVMLHADRISSDTTEADYYNSYYSTLVHDQRSEPAPNHRQRRCLSPSHSEDLHRSRQPLSDQSARDPQNSFSTRLVHPYAREIPRNTKTPPVLLRSTFTPSSHNADSIDPLNSSFTRLASSRTPKLKNSISTPDLRNSAALHNTIITPRIPIANLIPQQNGTPFAVPKIKDRWLSAETWCDAVLFPRPRLKAGIVPPLGGGSGRIVSPPGSPVLPDLTGVREPGVASRVLAHSLSLVDLNSPVGLSSSYVYPHTSTSRWHERDPQTLRAGLQSTTDLAQPKCVPTLAQYVFDFLFSSTFLRR
jgi:serine/arginine repetitive matrix protein 2